MSQNVTPESAPRARKGAWLAVVAAAAIPATWGLASVTSADSGGLPRAGQAAPAIAQAQVVTEPATFVGITPVRVLDTRPATVVGITPGGAMQPGQQLDVQVTGLDDIPAEATSVAINVTIDQDATLKSFITVWPTGEPRPLASTNNAEPGLVTPNSALMKVGTDGKISVFNQQGAVNVIIDVTGYFVPATTDTPPTSTTPDSTTPTSTEP